MKKRLQRIKFSEQLAACGYLNRQLTDLLKYHFDDMEEAADYLGCSVPTLYRYTKNNRWPVAQARLLLILHRGFLPTDKAWSGFRVKGDRLITPTGREFTTQELTIPKMIESDDSYRLLMRNKKRLNR